MLRHADRRLPASTIAAIALAAVSTACGAAIATETEEVPRATELTVRLQQTLNSNIHGSGSEFSAAVRDPVVDDEGRMLVPAGTLVRGHIADFQTDPPRLTLEFDRIEVREESLDLDAELVSMTPREHSEMTDEGAKIGGGAAAGALLGGIIGGGAKEAVIGAAAGAAAGAGVALATKDRHAFLPAGSLMTIRLIEPLEVRLEGDEQDEDGEDAGDGTD